MTEYTQSMCVICRVEIDVESNADTWVHLQHKGLATLEEFSNLRGDLELSNYLSTAQHRIFKVHTDCRKTYTNKRRYEQQQSAHVVPEGEAPRKLLRSGTSFDWREHCFLCGMAVSYDSRHSDKYGSSQVRTVEIKDNILRICDKRNDAWALAVQGRLQSCSDLFAYDALYHRQCHLYFSTLKSMPSEDEARSAVGRPIDQEMSQSFEKLCEWLEVTDDGPFSLDELRDHLETIAGRKDLAYSAKQLKRKLVETYQSHVFFAEVCGKKNVICFRGMASRIITEKWYEERRSSMQEESIRIVKAAAKLITAQIRETAYSNDCYPNHQQFTDVDSAKEWIPELLNVFMENVACQELKQVAISQCIVQAVRPRSSISPILFGLGVSLDHGFGSKWLLTTLSQLGMSVSYDEICRYKQSVVQHVADDLPRGYPSAFTQWSGDNVDHNTITLDGTGSFHGMGIISMSVPLGLFDHGHFPEAAVPRKQRMNVDSLVRNRGISMQRYVAPGKSALSNLCLKPLSDLHWPPVSQPSMNLDLIWHFGWFCCDEKDPRPNWAGFMQDVSIAVDEYRPAADIRMLPIIDVNPSDMSCIYSTLCFIDVQAKKLNMETACVTFDQPLWVKAVEIVHSCRLNVVCRLGGFHVLMNFLGAIGTIMAGSGLSEALQTCFGSVSISHMMTGKAYAKAVRGHILVDSALNVLLLQRLIDKANSAAEQDSSDSDMSVLSAAEVDMLKILYAETTNRNDNAVDGTNDVLKCASEKLSNFKSEVINKSRTAKLWVQYMYYINVVKSFLQGERTSDWSLHLSSMSKMLNLFAAAGHTNYAKCGRLYLQLMLELPNTHPWLHRQLNDGRCHAVRRSNRFWAGLSTDLCIEQVMMRAVKGRGGLTRGRGMNESVRLTWVKCLHQCATVHNALMCLTDVLRSTNDQQHVELGKSRRDKDYKDLTKLVAWFESSSPFSVHDNRLHSLSSGVVASESDGVNCDFAEDVGEEVMKKMNALPFSDVVLRKVDRAKTLSHVGGQVVVVDKRLPADSTILFSRLLVIMQRQGDIEAVFRHELTVTPAALFSGFTMRKANKSVLAKELCLRAAVDVSQTVPQTCVLDGGWLLHKLKWQADGTYDDVAEQYLKYVVTHFGCQTTVVFDGYGGGPSVKDGEHERRALKACPDIIVDGGKPVYGNQAAFLANDMNKMHFVAILITHFKTAGFVVHQARNDADTLIVSTALDIANKNEPVTVVANDTDILVLLLYHFIPSMADIFIHHEVTSKQVAHTSLLSVRQIRASIGDVAARQILVVHAISGCDSTSSLYGHGKGIVFRKITRNMNSVPMTDVIMSTTVSHDDVSAAGLQLLGFIYSGKFDQCLNRLRYRAYLDITSCSTLPLRPERLPPTENAARFHVYRVHLQVVQWQSLMKCNINPEDWGWKLQNGRYTPIASDIAAAPEDMLTVIRCKCKMETGRPCSSQLCVCMKHGLPCVAACKNCNGSGCHNSEQVESDDENVEEFTAAEGIENCIENVISEDVLEFDIPWITEEVVE